MRRQSIPYHQWIVLDDGITSAPCTMGQTHIRLEDTRGKASLAKKLTYLMQHSEMIAGDYVAFIEDDDWYRANYLEVATQRCKEGYDIIGEGYALYYNVRSGGWLMHNNTAHASLCQTLISRKVFPELLKFTQTEDPFIDFYLWRDANSNLTRKVFLPTEYFPTLVGIKGMYPGYGIGHSSKMKHYDDTERNQLIALIGKADAALYSKYKNP
jgi:hypothetical protein